MGDLTKMMAATTVPFTPASYDAAFPQRIGAVEVTGETSMTIPTVYACVTVISETIAAVPFQMFETLNDGGKRLARNHPLYDVLQSAPNEYQTALEFREMMTAFALLRGRGIAEKMPGRRGIVDQLKPLHPDLVWAEVTREGELRYIYQDPIRGRRVLLPDEVFVLRGKLGRSVIDYARVTFAAMLAMTNHQAEMYRRGVRFPGALSYPRKLDPDQRTNLRAAIDEYAQGGPRAGRPLLLEDGMTWTTIGMTNDDAQFVESANLNVSDVCRFFRVPPHKVAHMIDATFSNIEKQAIEFVTDTMAPWAERWEQSVKRDLIVASDRYFAEHNLDALSRGDIKTRYEAYATGRQWGWLATNDIRRRENMNPIPGGDNDYLTPLNMTRGDGTLLAFAPPKQLAALNGQLRTMVRDAAARAVRKETAALAKLAERTGGGGDDWTAGVTAFYDEHARFVASLLHLPDEEAERYCRDRKAAALDGTAREEEHEAIASLTTLALEQSEALLPPPEEIAA